MRGPQTMCTRAQRGQTRSSAVVHVGPYTSVASCAGLARRSSSQPAASRRTTTRQATNYMHSTATDLLAMWATGAVACLLAFKVQYTHLLTWHPHHARSVPAPKASHHKL